MSKGISFQCFGAATEKGAIAEYPGPAITRVGVLWRTGYITIDAILIQWDAHKWRDILQFSQGAIAEYPGPAITRDLFRTTLC